VRRFSKLVYAVVHGCKLHPQSQRICFLSVNSAKYCYFVIVFAIVNDLSRYKHEKRDVIDSGKVDGVGGDEKT
jgi:hypothetical protein